MTVKKLGLALTLTGMMTSLLAGPVSAAPLEPINHVDWMQEKAYVSGSKSGMALERPITLTEAVVMMARVQDVGKTIKTVDPSVKSTWAPKALTWAKQSNIVSKENWKLIHKQVSGKVLNEVAKNAGYELNLEGSKVTRQAFIEALGEAITVHVTIGHTNDVHGHVTEDDRNKEMGYAKLATLMKEIRSENTNTLMIDAGDMIQGTIYANLSQGESIPELANYLGYDMMVAGNHEFDFGRDQLEKVSKMFQFPVLGANVFDENNKQFLQPYVIKEVEGQKLAFLGLVTEETPITTHPDNVKGLTFKNPVEVAKEWVPKLQKMADNVIIVSHSGLAEDRQIAQEVQGIDLIIGGHSHTRLDKPEIVNGVYIVQDWEYSKSLGRIDMFYHNDELVHFSGGLLEYNKETEADAQMAKKIDILKEDSDELLNVKIAETSVLLDGERENIRAKETNLGNMIADAMLDRTQSISGHEAEVALTNGGGIRTTIQPGDITKRNLYDVLPFPNTLAVIKISGQELYNALEHGVGDIESGAGRFPQVAGMSFTLDAKAPQGKRVSDVKVGGKALDLNKTYSMVTNDFMAVGGDGYEMFKGKEVFNTGFTFYEVVEQYLIDAKTVAPKIDGRIKQ